jgi:tetratricopeptide (TPR) repeat protein
MFDQKKLYSFGKLLAFLFLGLGLLLGCYSLFSPRFTHPNLQPGAFVDRLPVPFSTENLGGVAIPIQVDHFLVFQNYQVTPYPFTPTENYLFGIFILLLSITVLANLSQFKKIPFLGAGIGWILLLTLTNLNGLNIGGLSSNLPLLLVLAATLIPTIYFHVWGSQSPFWVRWLVIAATTAGTVTSLLWISPIIQPCAYLAEQSILIGLGISIAWIFWQGHGILSGILILISKANSGLNTKTSIQFAGVSLLYLGILFLLLLQLKGEVPLPFADFSPLYLVLPIGLLGWISTREKLAQSDQLASSTQTLQQVYLLGFASTLWTIWKLTYADNQAGEELVKHLVIYSQLGFSLFFFIYVAINFFPLMHQGKTVHPVLYKPFILPYYHLRIGGTIAILVITTFLEAIIASQLSSLTSNIVGDYYYQTNQKLEASILYENSWDRYRYNPKAKNLTAQLLFELNQPSLAKEHLEESFDLAPQVDNIILLSERLQRENKPFEAVFYLENGLKFFPNNSYLSQNLALLYTLVKKEEKALALLNEVSRDTPLAASNWLAISIKLGKKVALPTTQDDLILGINRVAAARKIGAPADTQTLEILKSMLAKERAPLLLQAGYRNLLASQNLEDPSADIRLMDSLAKREDFLEYSMQFQETAILRGLGAGRISEAVKNLNGLAFRNPGDAAYYLNLSGLVLAQQLDFEKAAKDFAVSKEKGFQADLPIHEAIRNWQSERAIGRLATNAENEAFKDEFVFRGRFNQSMPQALFLDWKTIASPDFKLEMAWRLLSHKAHGLTTPQLQEIGVFLKGKTDRIVDLDTFLQAADWTNPNSLRSFTKLIGASEELTANPYFSPLIWAAAMQTKDKLHAYELLQSASEFNKDPLLWAKKIQAAQDLGLDRYAAEALEEMKTWMSEEEIEALLGEMY